MLRLFEFTARHGIRPSAEAERQIEARLPSLRRHFADPQPVWPELNRILRCRTPRWRCAPCTKPACSRRCFPELERIDCLVIRDFYHRYTVDEHTLVAMQNALRRRAEPLSRHCAPRCEQPGVLMFALLFHDSGKSAPHGGHVDASVRLAERRHGAYPDAAARSATWCAS